MMGEEELQIADKNAGIAVAVEGKDCFDVE